MRKLTPDERRRLDEINRERDAIVARFEARLRCDAERESRRRSWIRRLLPFGR